MYYHPKPSSLEKNIELAAKRKFQSNRFPDLQKLRSVPSDQIQNLNPEQDRESRRFASSAGRQQDSRRISSHSGAAAPRQEPVVIVDDADCQPAQVNHQPVVEQPIEPANKEEKQERDVR